MTLGRIKRLERREAHGKRCRECADGVLVLPEAEIDRCYATGAMPKCPRCGSPWKGRIFPKELWNAV